MGLVESEWKEKGRKQEKRKAKEKRRKRTKAKQDRWENWKPTVRWEAQGSRMESHRKH